MPWKLIAGAFGWRASFELDAARPVLVVWHPRRSRRFDNADAWKRAVLLSIRAPVAPLSRKEPRP